jgi:hypothetical protein
VANAAEIEIERAEVAADLAEDGAVGILRYDKSFLLSGSIDPPPPDYVQQVVYALIVSNSQRQESGELLPRRLRVLIADEHLGGLQELAGLVEGADPGNTGYEIFIDPTIQPDQIPSVDSATVVRYRVLALSETVRMGNKAILHYFDIVNSSAVVASP